MADSHATRRTDTLALLRRARHTTDERLRERLRQQVVVEHMRFAHSCAARLRGRGVDDDDLVQVAYLGLVKAVRGCDPDRCVDFLQYATPTIVGELKRHFRDHAWTVRPPRRLQEIQPVLAATRNDLMQRHGRQPTSRELAVAMGVPTADVNDAVVAGQGFSAAALDPFGEGSRFTAGDDPDLATVENQQLLATLLGDLTDREKRVLLLRYYLGWTQQEIGVELGLSQMQISRTLRGALSSLAARRPADEDWSDDDLAPRQSA